MSFQLKLADFQGYMNLGLQRYYTFLKYNETRSLFVINNKLLTKNI